MHLTFNISSLNPQRTVKAKWEQQHFLLPSIFTHVREGEQWIENEIPAKTYERHRERNFADKKGDKRNVEKMFSVVYGNKMQTWRARESVKPEKVTVSKIQISHGDVLRKPTNSGVVFIFLQPPPKIVHKQIFLITKWFSLENDNFLSRQLLFNGEADARKTFSSLAYDFEAIVLNEVLLSLIRVRKLTSAL